MNKIKEANNRTATITLQQILLDWQGYILESTDTIFDTKKLHYRPVEEWSSFYNSMIPVLHLLELDSPEIILPRINSVTNFTSGIYDCSFMRVEWGDNDKVIVWNIFDYTSELYQIQQVQQKMNEIRLRNIY